MSKDTLAPGYCLGLPSKGFRRRKKQVLKRVVLRSTVSSGKIIFINICVFHLSLPIMHPILIICTLNYCKFVNRKFIWRHGFVLWCCFFSGWIAHTSILSLDTMGMCLIETTQTQGCQRMRALFHCSEWGLQQIYTGEVLGCKEIPRCCAERGA